MDAWNEGWTEMYMVSTDSLYHSLPLPLLQDEWRFLIAGGTTATVSLPNPAAKWLTDRAWGDILKLTALPKYRSLPEEFGQFAEGFKRIFDSTEPHRFVYFVHSALHEWIRADLLMTNILQAKFT